VIRDFKSIPQKKLIKAIQNITKVDDIKKFSFEAQKSGRATNYKLWKGFFHPLS
jgi:hypothetical protein